MVQGTKASTSAFAAMHGFVENFANVKKKLKDLFNTSDFRGQVCIRPVHLFLIRVIFLFCNVAQTNVILDSRVNEPLKRTFFLTSNI
jgi:hypothetical protein